MFSLFIAKAFTGMHESMREHMENSSTHSRPCAWWFLSSEPLWDHSHAVDGFSDEDAFSYKLSAVPQEYQHRVQMQWWLYDALSGGKTNVIKHALKTFDNYTKVRKKAAK